MMGRKNTKKKIHSASARVLTSFHEAGHLAIAIWAQLPVRSATSKPNLEEQTMGAVDVPFGGDFYPGDWSGDFAQTIDRIVMSLAGKLAVHHAFKLQTVAESDDRDAWRFCRMSSRSDREARSMMAWCRYRTLGLLEMVWPAVDALATELVSRDALSGEEARRIFVDALSD